MVMEREDRLRQLEMREGKAIPPVPEDCPYLKHDEGELIVNLCGTEYVIDNDTPGHIRTIAGCIAAEFNQRKYDDIYRELKAIHPAAPGQEYVFKARLSMQAQIGIAWRRWMVAK